jgi:ABC-2 type transport system ATP-binding protein
VALAEAAAAEPAISIRGVSKRYGRVLALDGVDLEIPRGELFALVGPNGAGKTTLIHVLCTIVQPTGGVARLAGFDVVRQPLRARTRLGVVFQEPSLDDRLTVFENLNFHGLVFQVPTAERRRRIPELLDVVQLTEWRDRLVRTLSPGMKRRVEIARALVHNATILFLDEPTVGLDAQSRQRIWSYIEELRRQRELTVIVTTHYIEEVDSCDRVGIIDQGKVLVVDTPEALKAAYGKEVIRVVPRDEATGEAILARFPSAMAKEAGADGLGSAASEEILLPLGNGVSEEAFLGEFGSRVRQLTIDKPSLETVFLNLTGRELRDKAAAQREVTYSFGRRGGEHTR